MSKSVADKERKATMKNVSAAAEAKKRKGAGRGKVISKRWKVGAASAAASAGSGEEVESDAENVPQMAEEIGEMETSAADGASVADMEADLMASTIQRLGGGPIAGAPEVELMPSVFGHVSSSSSSEDGDDGAGKVEALYDEASTRECMHFVGVSQAKESEPKSEDRAPHGHPVQHEDPPPAEDTEVVGAA